MQAIKKNAVLIVQQYTNIIKAATSIYGDKIDISCANITFNGDGGIVIVTVSLNSHHTFAHNVPSKSPSLISTCVQNKPAYKTFHNLHIHMTTIARNEAIQPLIKRFAQCLQDRPYLFHLTDQNDRAIYLMSMATMCDIQDNTRTWHPPITKVCFHNAQSSV